jgi:hypothetical protein
MLVTTVMRHPLRTLVTLSRFFTIWNVVLIGMYKLTQSYVNLPFLTSVVAVIGATITYIHPREVRFTIAKNEFVVKGPELWAVDLIFHQLPLVFVLMCVKRGSIISTFIALAILAVYALSNNVQERYKIREDDMLKAIVVISIINLVIAF